MNISNSEGVLRFVGDTAVGKIVSYVSSELQPTTDNRSFLSVWVFTDFIKMILIDLGSRFSVAEPK